MGTDPLSLSNSQNTGLLASLKFKLRIAESIIQNILLAFSPKMLQNKPASLLPWSIFFMYNRLCFVHWCKFELIISFTLIAVNALLDENVPFTTQAGKPVLDHRSYQWKTFKPVIRDGYHKMTFWVTYSKPSWKGNTVQWKRSAVFVSAITSNHTMVARANLCIFFQKSQHGLRKVVKACCSLHIRILASTWASCSSSLEQGAGQESAPVKMPGISCSLISMWIDAAFSIQNMKLLVLEGVTLLRPPKFCCAYQPGAGPEKNAQKYYCTVHSF